MGIHFYSIIMPYSFYIPIIQHLMVIYLLLSKFINPWFETWCTGYILKDATLISYQRNYLTVKMIGGSSCWKHVIPILEKRFCTCVFKFTRGDKFLDRLMSFCAIALI